MISLAHWTGLAGLLAWVALELIVRSRSRSARSLDADRGDAGSTAILVAAYAAAVVLPLVLRAGPHLPALVAWIGAAAAWLGVLLRAWGMRTLGASYTRTLRTDENLGLVTAGPYRVLRHPGYTGSLLAWVGYTVSAGRLVPALIVAALLVAAYVWRIVAEERMLAARFGDQWRAYRRHTWRLVPLLY
jgi:protein-S-isoprenylcysteine O-methyltransferase Ste14